MGAGTGADAAPYYRVFNPVLQAQKFDPRGDYIARWVPELADLAPAQRHQPWTGAIPRGYVTPIVDLAQSRKGRARRARAPRPLTTRGCDHRGQSPLRSTRCTIPPRKRRACARLLP
jgi:hypothetical protein